MEEDLFLTCADISKEINTFECGSYVKYWKPINVYLNKIMLKMRCRKYSKCRIGAVTSCAH